MMDKFDKYIMNKKRDDYFRLKAKVITMKRNKENKMEMKTPSKKQILKASERCQEVKEVMQGLFPQAFEEEDRDITKECRVELDNNLGGSYFIRVYHGDEVVAYTGSNGRGTTELKIASVQPLGAYEVTVDDGGDFRIIKKGDK